MRKKVLLCLLDHFQELSIHHFNILTTLHINPGVLGVETPPDFGLGVVGSQGVMVGRGRVLKINIVLCYHAE